MQHNLKVLVIGSGGREHAICRKLHHSPSVSEVFALPGNPGISEIATCLAADMASLDSIEALVKRYKIDMTIVGPETVLAQGIVDHFQKTNLKIVGPTQNAAQLETSKVFCKNFCKQFDILTADYQVFSDYQQAKAYVLEKNCPLVVKVDGLAAGKGAIVCHTSDTAVQALDQIFLEKAFGDAGHQVIIEELLQGPEISFFALCDGKTAIPLAVAQDYKTLLDGQTGPNTGGMGSFCPTPIDKSLHAHIMERVINPTITGMNQLKIPFTGVLFAGFMLTPQGPYLLEYNVRFGDPETQSIMELLDSDLGQIFWLQSQGQLAALPPLKWKNGTAMCVVLASPGYPQTPLIGHTIEGLSHISSPLTPENTYVLHAGTKQSNQGDIVTNGGRVLNICSFAAHDSSAGSSLAKVKENIYTAIKHVKWKGMQYRTDIGDPIGGADNR